MRNVTLESITNYLIIALLFLLPWQTRLIYGPRFLNGGFWEYGTASLYGTEILAWMVLVLSLAGWWHNRPTRQFSPPRGIQRAVSLVLVFFLYGSLFWSLDSTSTYQYICRLLLGFGLLVIIRYQRIDTFLLYVAFWLGGVGQGILALVQFFTQIIPANKWLGWAAHSAADLGATVIETGSERWLRAYGSFGSPNSLGIYLAIIFVVGLFLLFQFQNKKYYPALLAGQLVIAAGLLVSFSRGAWLAAVVGVLGYAWYARRDAIRQLVPIGAVLLILCGLLQPLFAARFDLQNRLEARSVGERGAQVTTALVLLKDHFVLGVGPGAYTKALFKLDPHKQVFAYQPVHNVFLLTLVEFGFFGSFLLFGMLVVLVRTAGGNRIFFICIVTIAVAGLFDHWLMSMFTGQLLWLVTFALALRPIEFVPHVRSSRLITPCHSRASGNPGHSTVLDPRFHGDGRLGMRQVGTCG